MSNPYIISFIFFAISVSISAFLYLVYTLSPTDNARNSNFDRSLILIASTAFLWYSLSLSLTIYNKWLLQEFLSGVSLPITITLIHMTMKFIFSRLWKLSKPDIEIEPMTPFIRWLIAIPIGLATGLDISMSNKSISIMSISMYTILKSTVIGWTFIWGNLFGVETFSFGKLCSVAVLIGGLVLTVRSEKEDDPLIGILFGLGAACMGGMRLVLTQFLCSSDALSSQEKIGALHRFSPFTLLAVAPLVGLFEYSTINNVYQTNPSSLLMYLSFSLIGGVLACMLIITEISLLKMTSSLTMGVFGQLKEVGQILLAVVTFHDSFSLQTLIGGLICLCAAEGYRHIRMNENKELNELPSSSSSSLSSSSSSSFSSASQQKIFPSSPYSSLSSSSSSSSLSSSSISYNQLNDYDSEEDDNDGDDDGENGRENEENEYDFMDSDEEEQNKKEKEYK